MMAKGETAKRKCFVICPIGDDDSPERINTEWLSDHIINPVLENEEFGFEVQRADQFKNPGEITPQIIMALLEWDLVIADLTGLNPNVFYELAIRHMARKPAIHMMRQGDEKIPFDVQTQRTVYYSRLRPRDLIKAQEELKEKVRAVIAPGFVVTNPVSAARGIAQLDESGDPQDKVLASLVSDVSQIRRELDTIRNFAANLAPPPRRLSHPFESEVNSANALWRYGMLDDGVVDPSKGFGSDLTEVVRQRRSLARALLEDPTEGRQNRATKSSESEDN